MSEDVEKEQKIKKNTVFIPYKIYRNSCYSYKHSGDIGDLIYSLPIMRYYGGGHLQLNPYGLPSKKYDGSKSGFNKNIIRILTPLLQLQDYIHSVTIWDKKRVDVDIDYFRTNPAECDNLCGKILGTFHVPFEETDTPWITCEKKSVAHTVISRSFRYRNDRLSYNDFFENFKDCVFVGLPDEHEDFCKSYGNIDYYETRNFLEMAEVINGSKLFVGNQSAPLSIAIGLGVDFLQEYYPIHPDCIFDRLNAYYLYAKNKSE
jgi:hypothetical protein